MSDLSAMISSTALDLPEHRKQALDACLSMEVLPIAMEHLPARDASAVAASLEMVDKADIYIGIYGWRYGWIPDGSDISITEMEFNRAVKGGKTVLVFIMDDEHPVKMGDVETGDAPQKKLKAFKTRACDGRVRGKFKSSIELKAQIIHALADVTHRLKPKTGKLPLPALHQLPPAPAAFTGREEDLRFLESALATHGNIGAAISAAAGIHGMGGVGKTALATFLAHRLKDKYPDAQIYLNLRGFDPTRKPMPPAEAMQTVIHVFRPEERLPETAEELAPIYHSVLNDAGRVLLFLDNAADAGQIQPLMPPANCLLLVTSRNQFNIPGLAARNIDCLPPDKSRELLLKLAPRLKGHESAAADLCGCLPLALEVFAGVVREKTLHPVEDLLARLRKHDQTLGEVQAAFQVSCDLLEEPFRRCWALMGIFPAGFDLPAAAAIWEMETEASRDIMEGLMKGSLVKTNEAKDRFRLHDLVRQFCDGKLGAAERDSAMMRYAGHYTTVGAEAKKLFLKDRAGVVLGLELFDRERIHIEASYEWLASKRDAASATLLTSLVNAVAYTGDLRFHPRQRIRWLESQREAARIIKNRRGEGNALGNLGLAYFDLGEPRKAIGFFEQTLAIAREIGDRCGEGTSLGNLGNAYLALGEPRKAIGFYQQALVIDREIGDRRGEGADLGNLGSAYADLGEPRKAIEFYEQALAIDREIGDRRGEGNALGNLGIAYKNLGEPRKAIEFYEQQLVIAREIGDRRGEGQDLGNLGLAYADLGEPRKAIELYEQALAIHREIGHRRGEDAVLGNLGSAYASLGELRKAIEFYEQALAIDREIGDRRGEGNDLYNSALALDKLGERAQAIARAEAALAIFEAIEDPNAAKVRALLEIWKGTPVK